MASLKEIRVYPVKSLPGISLSAHFVHETGLLWDRQWMLVDPNGHFITQRQEPRLNTIRVSQSPNGLVFQTSDRVIEDLFLPFQLVQSGKPIPVQVWNSGFSANRSYPEASEWFSRFLNKELELVEVKPGARMKKNNYWPRAFPLNFSDAYPIHLINLASIRDLSKRIGTFIHPDQFRANLVLDELEPYEEDRIRSIRLGDLELVSVKKCERCIMTGLSPGQSEIGKEPLKTLSGYRRQGNSVNFGIYLIPKEINQPEGTKISISDKLGCYF